MPATSNHIHAALPPAPGWRRYRAALSGALAVVALTAIVWTLGPSAIPVGDLPRAPGPVATPVVTQEVNDGMQPVRTQVLQPPLPLALRSTTEPYVTAYLFAFQPSMRRWSARVFARPGDLLTLYLEAHNWSNDLVAQGVTVRLDVDSAPRTLQTVRGHVVYFVNGLPREATADLTVTALRPISLRPRPGSTRVWWDPDANLRLDWNKGMLTDTWLHGQWVTLGDMRGGLETVLQIQTRVAVLAGT